MKITKLIALLLVSVITFSCGSDDDGDSGTISINGTWKMTAFLSENAYDLNSDGTSSNNVIVETGCYDNELIIINSDGTSTVISNSYLDIILELVAGTTDQFEYVFNCVLENETLQLDWILDGTTVSFLDGNDVVAEATLSNNTLTFVLPGAYDVDVEENGVIVTITEDLTYIYTKQ